jgi:hypothetical protein
MLIIISYSADLLFVPAPVAALPLVTDTAHALPETVVVTRSLLQRIPDDVALTHKRMTVVLQEETETAVADALSAETAKSKEEKNKTKKGILQQNMP